MTTNIDLTTQLQKTKPQIHTLYMYMSTAYNEEASSQHGSLHFYIQVHGNCNKLHKLVASQ